MNEAARVVIVQTHVPSFRLEVFSELCRRCRGSFEVWSGEDYFTPTSGVPARRFAWNRNLKNHFILRRIGLWQSGHIRAAYYASICVLEFNPRVLSSWFLLIARRLTGRPTVLWGHLFPRAGSSSPTMFLRLAMLELATQANAYTYDERDRMARAARLVQETVIGRIFKSISVNVSPNALMWARDFHCPRLESARRFRVLFVARLVEDKKPELLLEAFAKALPELPPQIQLDFIGAGPHEPVLRDRIKALNLVDRVILHGAIYDVARLRNFYAEAVVAVSPGYVGLSATQSFAFGVPMLIADGEQHSVEIELCRRGFNCEFFQSNDPRSLAEGLVEFVTRPPVWSLRRDDICADVRSRYTLDAMCDGFMRLFDPHVSDCPALAEPVHVAIAWIGLPYYAARVIAEVMRRHPSWRFTIISSRDNVPYKNTEDLVGNRVHWIDANKPTSWSELGEPEPDIFLITSWPHVAYQTLATEAKRNRDTVIVSMVDNYLRYTIKQFIGFFYFRIFLRPLYSAMWVPGEYSMRFMRFLGVVRDSIYTGLYAADGDIFSPPSPDAPRKGIVFVGQYVRRKGVSNLAAAVKHRAGSGQPLDLRLFGQGPLREELLAQGMRVEEFKQPRELAEIYRDAAALILPSYVDHWGVVVHEAALCGCLLLITRQCGCAHELVQHGVNGYVMSQSSSAEILAAIAWLEGLDATAVAKGRAESLRRARAISPQHWAETLDAMVVRFVPRVGVDPVQTPGLT
jgi:glycosyltransferase involved in cell wall biosynthesis